MSFLNKLFVFCLVMFCWQYSGAQDVKLIASEIDQLNVGIKKMNERTRSISSEFTQLKNLSFLSEKVESKGNFYFEKNNKIRWEYKEPSKYIIVINGDKVYIDNNVEKKQYSSNSGRGFKAMNKMIVRSMDGSIAQDEDYNVTYFKSGKNYRILLEPKSKNLKSFVRGINLFIDGADFSVNGLKLIESEEGDYTEIKFEKKAFNQTLDSKLFDGF